MKTKLLTALFLTFAAPALAGEKVEMFRAAGCICCEKYADYLRASGYDVTITEDQNFVDRALATGMPEAGIGCHLAMMDGYAMSGLIPVEFLDKLVKDRPEVTGIVEPGMPMDAPGMSEGPYGTYKVYAFAPGGVITEFASE